MKLATTISLCLIAFLVLGSALNADLVRKPFPVNTGFDAVEFPVILILVLFAAGSWLLFLLITSVSQGVLLQKIQELSVALDEKDRELFRVKATFFDETLEPLNGVPSCLDRRQRNSESRLAGLGGGSALPSASRGRQTG